MGIYYGDMSSTVLLQPVPLFAYTMRHFWTLANGPAANVPQYCFLEPNYGVYRQASENDQHPMSDVVAGDQFIRDVYNAIRANDALWQSSLLVIIYDEHGGFYDHVPQPATVPPDNYRDGSGFNFDRLGVRVPAVLVSPWLDQGVISDTFDHTSVLKFLIEQFGLATTLLGDRVAAPTTNTFTKYLRKSLRSTYGLLPPTNQDLITLPDNLPQSDLQKTLIDLGQHLATQISDPTVRHTLTAQPTDPSPRAQGRLAVEQFEAFLTDRAKQRPASTAASTGAAKAKPRKAKARKAKGGKKAGPRSSQEIGQNSSSQLSLWRWRNSGTHASRERNCFFSSPGRERIASVIRMNLIRHCERQSSSRSDEIRPMGLTVATRSDCCPAGIEPISFALCQRGRRHDLLDIRPRSFCSAA